MNKNEEMKRAEKFKGERSCYIKAEMKDGVTELAVGGGTLAIIYTTMLIVRRLSELSGIPFNEVAEAVKKMYEDTPEKGVTS